MQETVFFLYIYKKTLISGLCGREKSNKHVLILEINEIVIIPYFISDILKMQWILFRQLLLSTRYLICINLSLVRSLFYIRLIKSSIFTTKNFHDSTKRNLPLSRKKRPSVNILLILRRERRTSHFFGVSLRVRIKKQSSGRTNIYTLSASALREEEDV